MKVVTHVWLDGQPESSETFHGLTIHDAAIRFASRCEGDIDEPIRMVASRGNAQWPLVVRQRVTFDVSGLRGGE